LEKKWRPRPANDDSRAKEATADTLTWVMTFTETYNEHSSTRLEPTQMTEAPESNRIDRIGLLKLYARRPGASGVETSQC
jgi:hypothetical protein